MQLVRETVTPVGIGPLKVATDSKWPMGVSRGTASCACDIALTGAVAKYGEHDNLQGGKPHAELGCHPEGRETLCRCD
jgi:hypothetical protein